MLRARTQPPTRTVPLELRWGRTCPLPTRWVVPDGGRLPDPDPTAGFDFTARMRALCADVAHRCPDLHHIHVPRVLISFTPSRNRSRFGLQARVTPLRFQRGALTRRHGTTEYQVQRYIVDDRDMLYLLTFCLPRFLDQSFAEKIVTVFHELFHIGPAFDGDLRRHPGRYAVHTSSKAEYDERMMALAREYLTNHPNPGVFSFLRTGYRELWSAHGGVKGVVVPRPKLLPVGTATRPAARDHHGQG